MLILKFFNSILELLQQSLCSIKSALTFCKLFFAVSDSCSCCCELARSCCIICLALCKCRFAFSELYFRISELILTIEVSLLVLLELVESVLKLVHVSCGLFTCLFPVVLASEKIVYGYSTAVKSE